MGVANRVAEPARSMGVIEMARRITHALRSSTIAALGLVAASALVSAAPAAAAGDHARVLHRAPRFAGQLYIFSGTIAAAPATSSSALSVTVTGGNRPALRALVGNTSAPLSFTVDGKTAYIAWTATSRGNAPSATTADALKVGDPVHLRIRARFQAPLARLLTRPVRSANDYAAAERVTGRLYLFGGRAISVDTTAQTITVDIRRGNWFALNALLGQPTTETFHYDSATQFLSWSGRAPHTFLPAQIKAGDPITIRTRAHFGTPLANLLAAPLWKVNDHEPSLTIDSDGGTLPVGN
jgi:hypothetical protein